jgi:hypothetical protein
MVSPTKKTTISDLIDHFEHLRAELGDVFVYSTSCGTVQEPFKLDFACERELDNGTLVLGIDDGS